MRRVATVWLLLVLCGPAATARAQSTFSSVHVNGLPTVYVTDRTGQETRGKLVSFTESAIALEVNGATRTFTADEVSLIERRGDSLKNGTIIGLVFGGVAGVLAGGLADCSEGRGGCAGARVAGTLLAVGFYAAVGAGIDAAIPGRTRIWPAKS